MGTNSLTNVTSGTIEPSNINDVIDAFNEDFVGRNSSGDATSGQNLGTASIPWGTVRTDQMILNGTEISPNSGFPTNGVISGAVRSATSNQPAFLQAAGSGNGLSVTLLASSTDLVYDVDGSEFTLTSDIVLGGLTAAPSTNNTCLVNDSTAADQVYTRIWGETQAGRNIGIDTVGSEISSLTETFQCFSLNNGSSTEYLLAFVALTGASDLNRIYRGWFFDSSLAPVQRIVFSNNDTFTLLQANWLFLDSDLSTLEATTTNPVWSAVEPSSPSTGDYWFDLSASSWKRYNGSAFVDTDRIFVGIAVCDDTDCIATRSVDFARFHKKEKNLKWGVLSNTEAQFTFQSSTISVFGNDLQYNFTLPKWDITTDLAPSSDLYNATEQASTRYYFYIKDTGETVISDVEPQVRYDLKGYYNPHNPWRCVGWAFNNGSSNLDYQQIYPTDIEDTDIDFFKTQNNANTLDSFSGSTFQTISLNSTQLSNGTAIVRNSNAFNFRQRDWYRVSIRGAYEKSAAGSGASEHEFRFQNTTKSITMFTTGRVAADTATNIWWNFTLINPVFIDFIEDDYSVQVREVTGGSTINLYYTSVYIERIGVVSI